MLERRIQSAGPDHTLRIAKHAQTNVAEHLDQIKQRFWFISNPSMKAIILDNIRHVSCAALNALAT